MKKIRSLAFHDRQHIQRILMQQNAVGLAFNQFIAAVSPHLRKWTDRGGDSVWVRNSSVEKAIDKALLVLQTSLHQNITEFQADAWKGANIKNDDMVSRFIDGMAISSLRRDGMFRQNMEAFKGLQKEVDANGLNVSRKVWKITDQAKTNLEFYLDSGISSGRSASGISSDIRQILDKPDKRFRRVRDENGKLQLSKPMEDYHPGAGVYRSSRMNALRLAATTTNVAYRKADYERWQNLDFILGIEISRSPSNHGPCKICDAMVGKYPKGFQFLGFHPFCICIATPILQKPEDFADFLLDDEIPKEQLITDIPADARKFMLDNEYMQKSYAFRDNAEWFSDKPVNNTQGDKIIVGSNVPSGLNTLEQQMWINNVHDTEDRLNITQGNPMSFEEADGKSPNPNFETEWGYKHNCQSCVVAYELRRRGYNVEALMKTLEDDNIPRQLSYKTEWAWIDPKTGQMPKKFKAGGEYIDPLTKKIKVKTEKVMIKELIDNTKVPGRYHIAFNWKGKSIEGHIITLERLDNNQVVLYDPQTGDKVNWADLKKRIRLSGGIRGYRVDNMLINEKIINGVVRSSKRR